MRSEKILLAGLSILSSQAGGIVHSVAFVGARLTLLVTARLVELIASAAFSASYRIHPDPVQDPKGTSEQNFWTLPPAVCDKPQETLAIVQIPSP
jgi:hypothetical protein